MRPDAAIICQGLGATDFRSEWRGEKVARMTLDSLLLILNGLPQRRIRVGTVISLASFSVRVLCWSPERSAVAVIQEGEKGFRRLFFSQRFKAAALALVWSAEALARIAQRLPVRGVPFPFSGRLRDRYLYTVADGLGTEILALDPQSGDLAVCTGAPIMPDGWALIKISESMKLRQLPPGKRVAAWREVHRFDKCVECGCFNRSHTATQYKACVAAANVRLLREMRAKV